MTINKERLCEEVKKVASNQILAPLLTWAESTSENDTKVKAMKEIVNSIFWKGLEKIKEEIRKELGDEIVSEVDQS